jgi:hypothetical protein
VPASLSMVVAVLTVVASIHYGSDESLMISDVEHL